MADDLKSEGPTGAGITTPKAPRPEEAGVDPAAAGHAIEPEATHNVTDGAARAGDRMWGPPGTPAEK